MMRKAPLGHDGAAAADDTGHALGRQRDETQQHASVNGEVIDALLGLLDERVTENLPCQGLGASIHLLERLVNRHGANRDGGVADDPFAGGVDVFAGREIHHRVGAPFGGPAHFLDLLLDARCDGAIADIGIDLHEEVTADDHWLGFRVVDVGGDDGAAASHLVSDEFRRDFVRDIRSPRVAGMLMGQRVGRRLAFAAALGQAHVFADGDVLHLRRDDALPRVPELGDRVAGGGAERPAFQPRKLGELAAFLAPGGLPGVCLGEVAVVE